MRNPKGFTLMEVLVTMAIIIVAGTLLLSILVSSTGLFYKESSKVTQGLNVNDALSEINIAIKNANAVAESYTDGATIYTTGADKLVLRVSSLDSSNNLLDNSVDYFVFFLNEKTLHLKIFPSAESSRKNVDRIFSTNAESLNFEYFDSANPPLEVTPMSASKVRVNLTLREKAGAGVETVSDTTEANLRND